MEHEHKGKIPKEAKMVLDTLTPSEIKAIDKAARTTSKYVIPKFAVLKSSWDYLMTIKDMHRAMAYLIASKMRDIPDVPCEAIDDTIKELGYDPKKATMYDRIKVAGALQDEFDNRSSREKTDMAVKALGLDPGLLSSIDYYNIERMDIVNTCYVGFMRLYSNKSEADLVGAFKERLADDRRDPTLDWLLIDDETGECEPLFGDCGDIEYEETATPGYEQSALWGAFHKGKTKSGDFYGAGLLTQAIAMRKCVDDDGSIDREMLAAYQSPAAEIGNGVAPHFAKDSEIRGQQEAVINEAEKSAVRFFKPKGGRPKLKKPVSKPVSKPNDHETRETDETDETNRNEPNHSPTHEDRIESNLTNEEIDKIITRAALKIRDGKPSRNKWRTFISDYGEAAFNKLVDTVASMSNVTNKGAKLNTILDVYEPPEKPKQKVWKADDWELCFERCKRCTGVGCKAGVLTPPEKDTWVHPPEECPHFIKKPIIHGRPNGHREPGFVQSLGI